MRFQLLTLIDITKTNARKSDGVDLQKQQQNYLTALQTISMRANPIINSAPLADERDIKGLGFGTSYKNKHKIWKLNFEFEFDTSHSVEMLKSDFNLIPIIARLTETVELKDAAFITNSKEYTNVVFRKIDDFE